MEWQAYYSLEPMGEQRADLRFAKLCSIIVNIARSVWRKKGQKPKMTSPKDFMPRFDLLEGKTPKRKQTDEEMKDIFLGFAGAHNKTIKK
jgi:hypothetical protein